MSTIDRILHSGFVGILFMAIFLMNCPESSAVKCDLCNGDFAVLGRHRWRCTGPKGRFTSAVHTAPNEDHRINMVQVQPGNNTTNVNPAPKCQISSDGLIKCVCGRSCKGRRGLSAHQRCCKAAQSLSSQYQVQSPDNIDPPGVDQNNDILHNDSLDGDTSPPVYDHWRNDTTNSNINSPGIESNDASPVEAGNSQFKQSCNSNFKAGVRLPKTKSDWNLANAYIHSIFNEYDWNKLSENFEHIVLDIQNKIYSYFEATHGSMSSNDSQFEDKYQNKTTKDLKSALKALKSNHAVTLTSMK